MSPLHLVEACGIVWLSPLQSECHRHALTLAPRRLCPLCGWHGHISRSHTPTLLVSDLESYLDFQRCLREWRIAINVSKSCAIIFAKGGRCFIQPRLLTLYGEPFKRAETTRYLGYVWIDSPGRLTSIRLEGQLLKEWACCVPSSTERVISPSGAECWSICGL
jgi:hypothetical protein